MTSSLRCVLLACAVAGAGPAAAADPVAEFYKGRTVSVYVGFPPGGGYDIYARLVAPYLAKHIPGNPSVVIQNMDGGVGVRAAAFLSNASPQNGTALGVFLDGVTLAKALGGPGNFDPARLQWIGRIVSTATFALSWHTSPARTVAEAKLKPLTIGATTASSSSSFIPLALNDLVGTKFKVIKGYTGANQIALAMEKGEVDAVGGIALEVITTAKRDWLTDRKADFLYCLGARRHGDYPNVPCLLDFATDDKSRRIFSLLGGIVDIGRSLAAEPGTPPERVAALRKAFMNAMQDETLRADATRRNLSLEPLEGAQLQSIVQAAMDTPPDLIGLVKRYFSGE